MLFWSSWMSSKKGQGDYALKCKSEPFQQSGARDQAKAFFNIVPFSHLYLMVIHLLKLYVFWRVCSLYKKCLSALLISSCSFYIKKKVLFPAVRVIKAILFHMPRCSSKVNLSIQFNQEVTVLWYPWDMQNEKVMDPECLEHCFSTH